MAANDIGEIKMDSSDLPLKQEDFPVLASPVIYGSVGGQLQGTSDQNCTDTVESNSSEQCGITLRGLEAPCAISLSTEQTGHVVKNLKFETFTDHVLDVAKYSCSKDVNVRKGQWPHLYQMVGGPKHTGSTGDPLSRAKDKLIVSNRENSRRSDIDAWNMRCVKTKNVDETRKLCVDVMQGKNLNPESALLPQDARLRMLSTSSFSNFFGKKNTKGKGVIHELGDKIHKTNMDSGGNLESNGRILTTAGMSSDVHMQHCSSEIVNHAGVNLREWLKAGRVKNKVESLNIFRQIAELVSLTHSQGVVLQQLRPSYIIIMPSNKLKYIGSSTQIDLHVPQYLAGCKKRPPQEDINAFCFSDMKQQKLMKDMEVQNHSLSATFLTEVRNNAVRDTENDIGSSSGSYNSENMALSTGSYQANELEKSRLADIKLEEMWYACPEELDEKACKFSSNIYCLGLLLFEVSEHSD